MTIFATPASVIARFPQADIEQGSFIDQPGMEGVNSDRLQAICDRANDWATGKLEIKFGAAYVPSEAIAALVKDACEYFVLVELTKADKDSSDYLEWVYKRTWFDQLTDTSTSDGGSEIGNPTHRIAFQIRPGQCCPPTYRRWH